MYACSGMVGGKGSEEVVQCLEHMFQKRGIGAERVIINCDGAILTYKLLMFDAFICHPKNPNRYFKSVWNTSPETGHSRLQADAINAQCDQQFKKKSSFGTCKERVDWLNDKSTIEAHEFKCFATMPEIFAEIFLPSDKWKDENGYKALIQKTKGLIYEFGESPEWDDEIHSYKLVEHPDQMWIRCNEDLTKPVRKLNIFSEKWKDVTREQLLRLKRGRQEPPVIPKATLDDTHAIANTMLNGEQLLRYYTPARVDESGEIEPVKYTPKPREMDVKVKRREQHNHTLESGERVELEKFYDDKTDENNSCTEPPSWEPAEVSEKLKEDLKDELRLHELKVGGKKAELVARLLKHYDECHKVNDCL